MSANVLLQGEEACWANSPLQSDSSVLGTDILPVQEEVFPGNYQWAPDESGSTAHPREGTNSSGYFSPKVNTAAFCTETAHLVASQSGKGKKEASKTCFLLSMIIHLLIYAPTFSQKHSWTFAGLHRTVMINMKEMEKIKKKEERPDLKLALRLPWTSKPLLYMCVGKRFDSKHSNKQFPNKT